MTYKNIEHIILFCIPEIFPLTGNSKKLKDQSFTTTTRIIFLFFFFFYMIIISIVYLINFFRFYL